MSSDEDNDMFDDNMLNAMQNIMSSSRHSMPLAQVSGWDDDNEGVDEETDPHESPQKEILWAAENGKLDVAEKLIAEDPSLVHVKDWNGYTPLHRACYNDHVDVVQFLLTSGANIGAQTEDKWQPLHSACRWNNAQSAAKLLEHGADINALTDGGHTPLHMAATNSYAKETLQLLLMHPLINAHIKNSNNETAGDIAKRAGRHYRLFEMADPCISDL